jgi:hypothetical protein
LLFPDGRLGPRGFWLLRLYLAAVAASLVGSMIEEAAGVITRPVLVNVNGGYAGNASASGVAGSVANVAGWAWVLLPPMWVAFVGRQVRAWRRASQERRQQLKWLMTGSGVTMVGLGLVLFSPPPSTVAGHIMRDIAAVLLMAVPAAIAVAILRYRLYEIDRLVSRTISYALVTAVLAGVYVGGVTLATRVLPFSSPVGVAASTLAAVALFTPLRRRVQQRVDRRFNRANYDSGALVSLFTARLRDAVQLETVRTDLLTAVSAAVEPAHISLWIRPISH